MEWQVQLCELNYDRRELNAVNSVIESGWLTMGPIVAEFEKGMQKFLCAKHQGIAVSSATAGLHLILMNMEVGPGDEVIIPALTFVSDANVVLQLGATPVFADINSENDLGVDINDVIKKITDKTKAIVLVHFAGYPCDFLRLRDIAKSKNIKLIEDCAHSPGAKISEKKCGTLGDYSFFSFFSNKNLSTGEGGMIFVNNNTSDLEKLRALRSHGMSSLTFDRHNGRASSYGVNAIGLNYRFDEIRAALGNIQLEKLQSGNLKRKKLVENYKRFLSNVDVKIPYINLPLNHEGSFHIMPILLNNTNTRDQLMNYLKENHIQSSIHYPSFQSFAAYKYHIGLNDCPKAKRICDIELTLPLHPKMTVEDVEFICNHVKSFTECKI